MCWDNLVRFDRKAEETVLNQGSKVQQNTSALVLPLHLPPLSDDTMDDEIEAYNNVVVGCARAVGLPRELLFKQVDYSCLQPDPAEFLELDLLKSHVPQIADKLVADVLTMLCGDGLLHYRVDDKRIKWDSTSLAQYLRLGIYRPDFHKCATMAIDETTIDGTVHVIDTLLEYIGTSATQLTDRNRVLLCYGDQLTYKNLKALKDLRLRESDSDRFSFAVEKPAYLHTSMAMVDAVMRCNWGRPGGRDSGCLSRFAATLGRSRAN